MAALTVGVFIASVVTRIAALQAACPDPSCASVRSACHARRLRRAGLPHLRRLLHRAGCSCRAGLWSRRQSDPLATPRRPHGATCLARAADFRRGDFHRRDGCAGHHSSRLAYPRRAAQFRRLRDLHPDSLSAAGWAFRPALDALGGAHLDRATGAALLPAEVRPRPGYLARSARRRDLDCFYW